MEPIDKFVAGVIAIGIITAFGLHATGLSSLTKSVGGASSQVLGTAETGKVS